MLPTAAGHLAAGFSFSCSSSRSHSIPALQQQLSEGRASTVRGLLLLLSDSPQLAQSIPARIGGCHSACLVVHARHWVGLKVGQSHPTVGEGRVATATQQVAQTLVSTAQGLTRRCTSLLCAGAALSKAALWKALPDR